MRTYGRIEGAWVEVKTSPDGDDSQIWLTTLCQTLKLNRNESPFYANYGIPAQEAVQQQLYPDLYMAQTQEQFTQYFVSLSLAKLPAMKPTYRIVAVTPKGALIDAQVAT